MGFFNNIKKISITLLISCLLGIIVLSSCNTRNDLEVTKIIFMYTGGDIDKSEVYVFTPDLTISHQIITPAANLSKISEFPLSKDDVVEEESLTITNNFWQSIVNALKRNDFIALPEEITTADPGYDFSDYYIYVETSKGSHLAGGYAAGYGNDANNRRFADVHSYIESAIDSIK